MTISCRNLLGAVILVGATTFITSEVASRQDEPGAGQDAAMEQWKALAEPGPEHARLTKLVGTWNQDAAHWMYPGAEPNKWTSKGVNEAVLGGRFLTQHVTGAFEFAGQTFDFEGMGLYGYDNLEQKHFYAWVDNMGTTLTIAEGGTDAAGNIVYYGTMPDPAGGGSVKVKSVLRFDSESSYTFEMHFEQPDGSWFKNMEVTSRRAS